MKIKDLKIGVLNDKGGVGKSAIVMQIALANNLKVIELDTYGNIAKRVPNTVSFEEGERVKLPRTGGYVVDFGGFAHTQEDYILSKLDVLVIPFLATAESVETTYNMIDRFEIDIPILFVANRISKKDEKAVLSAFGLFNRVIDGANLSALTESRAIQSAINNGFDIVSASGQKGLKGQPYRKMAEQLKKLFEKIENTVEGEIVNV